MLFMSFFFPQYEHIVMLELLEKGQLEPEKKIGAGIFDWWL